MYRGLLLLIDCVQNVAHHSYVYEIIADYQRGFKRKPWITDKIFCIQQALEKE